jgi:voltage-gated sodium channel
MARWDFGVNQVGPIERFVISRGFQNFVILVIIANAVVLGLATVSGLSPEQRRWIEYADEAFLVFFCIELVIKLAVMRFDFFRSGWNIFDLIIVAGSLPLQFMGGFAGVSILRALRVVRLTRILSLTPQMRRVMEAMFHALPGIFSILVLLLLFFYIGAVMATTLFGPQHADMFGNIGKSMLTLFKISIFDGWGDIVDTVEATHAHAWLFFLVFTIFTAFTVLNLFVGVIVDAMQEKQAEHLAEMAAEREAKQAETDAAQSIAIKELRGDQEETEAAIEELEARKTTMERDVAALLMEMRAMRAEFATLTPPR